MCKRTKVGDITLEVLKETDNPAVMWGDCGLLDTIGERAGWGRMHPLVRWQRVLNALDRDERFEKWLVDIGEITRGPRYVRKFNPKGGSE